MLLFPLALHLPLSRLPSVLLSLPSTPPAPTPVCPQVFRAHYSALTPQEIGHAYNNLSRLDLRLALAQEAQEEIDLKVCCLPVAVQDG